MRRVFSPFLPEYFKGRSPKKTPFPFQKEIYSTESVSGGVLSRFFLKTETKFWRRREDLNLQANKFTLVCLVDSKTLERRLDERLQGIEPLRGT